MKPMYYGIPFSPQATLTDTIGAADTIIKVSDVSAFPDAPNYATIGTDEGGETILYTAKTANALSGCTRGVEGSAKSWNAGELIGRNYTAADHAAMIDNIKDAAKTAEADGVTFDDGEMEMSRNVQSGNTQNLKSMVIQRSFPKWSVAERRKTAAASDQAAVCACAHSRYFAGGSPSGLRV